MSQQKSAGAWTGLILAAVCLGIVAHIFYASSADRAHGIYIVDRAAPVSAS